MDPKVKRLLLKTFVFAVSLSFAWWILKSSYLENIVEAILPLRYVSEIVAGILYSSFIASPVSIAMLVILAKTNNPIITALLAGTGTMIADLLIVRFFKSEISSDLNLVSKEFHLQKVTLFLKAFHLDFFIPLLGAIIIASPLPDELGLMMLGASKLSYRELAVLCYVLNTAGILLIVAPINLIS